MYLSSSSSSSESSKSQISQRVMINVPITLDFLFLDVFVGVAFLGSGFFSFWDDDPDEAGGLPPKKLRMSPIADE